MVGTDRPGTVHPDTAHSATVHPGVESSGVGGPDSGRSETGPLREGRTAVAQTPLAAARARVAHAGMELAATGPVETGFPSTGPRGRLRPAPAQVASGRWVTYWLWAFVLRRGQRDRARTAMAARRAHCSDPWVGTATTDTASAPVRRLTVSTVARTRVSQRPGPTSASGA